MKRLFWINPFWPRGHLFSDYVRVLSLVLVFICFCQTAKADWISVCQASFKPDHTFFQKAYYKSNGDRFWLSISVEKPSLCSVASIPEVFSDKQVNVLWAGLIAKDVALRLGNRPILHGYNKDNSINISEIIPQQQASNPLSSLVSPALLNVNLLNDFETRVFGVEARVQIDQVEEHLKVHCAAGTKPAGVLLKIEKTRLPDKTMLNVPLSLALRYRGDAGVQMGMSDQSRFDRGDPLILSELAATAALSHQQFYVPNKLNRNAQWHVSFVCPNESATLFISDIQLVAKTLVGTRGANKRQGRGLWFWRPQLWRHSAPALLEEARKYHTDRVFISIELDEESKVIKHQSQLVTFIRLAADNHVKVWVVEGDPRVVLPDDRRRFIERSKILSAFNREQTGNTKLGGIQYDIEPYLVAGYALRTERWAAAYVETISQLHRTVNMPLEIVIPFWWNQQMIGDKSLLDLLVPYVERVNIMNYRTSVDLLERFAQPMLAWGVRNNRQVSIALEAGSLVAEQQWRFEKSKRGELWQVQIEDYDVLIYLDKAMIYPGANVFKQVTSRELSIDVITFKNQISVLKQILPDLEQSWGSWSSFSGISLHGMDELRFSP